MSDQKLFYPGDDVQTPFKRAGRAPRPTKLRANITPGTVLIVLSGRFRGRRVVFIKQLPSGLLLVTGPYKLNGVPIRRVNQAYVIPTSTKVDISGVNADDISDEFFARSKAPKSAQADQFFEGDAQLSEEEKAKLQKKYEKQAQFDASIIASIKKVEYLAQYMGTRFSLRNKQYPHLLSF